MKHTQMIFTICALTAGTLLAQDPANVDSVLKEIDAYQAAPAAAETVPVRVDVPEVLDASRVQYVAGDYAQAQTGFEAVLAADPENKTAAYYLQQITDTRNPVIKETAMKEIDAGWSLLMRHYAVSDRFIQGMGLEGTDNVTDVAERFSAVEFPEGSSALYFPNLRKLVVKNTPVNLKKIEETLTAFGQAENEASEKLVEIETRFVEFNEGALEELGFNWSSESANVKLGGDWAVNDGGSGPQDLFSGAMRSLPFEQTGSLGVGEVGSRTGSSRVDNWKVNRIEDMFNSSATGAGTLGLSGNMAGNAIDLLIRALDQTAGVDILSAPRIVTLSGESATITVGERHYYPDTYQAGTSQNTMVHVIYNGFTEKILGVEMKVTPEIKDEEIKMKINPRITELLGWQQFQIAPADSSYTYYQFRVGSQYEHAPVVAKLPLFERREIKTEVSVASGATIAMGGLIGEKKEAFNDRVPVLGSIPLVGRLFRSEGERTVKRNLMIFVTPRKMQPNGMLMTERTIE